MRWSYRVEDHPKLETIENEFRLKLQELSDKIENKLDLVEYEATVNDIKKKINGMS